jgi:signal transduction histidine kinase
MMREKEIELARVSRTLMVGEMASSIAHEVNQPLAGVVANAAAGLRWLDGETPNIEEAKNSLDLIARDGNRASAVIRRVREFVKSESNGALPLDIREIIRETITLAQFDLEKNHIQVNLSLSDELPVIRGDRVQLEQVILNLVMNALEAMTSAKDRRGELLISANNSPNGSNGSVLVSVRDSGVGIDPGEIDKIYDPFFTTKPMGVGMGLSISRSIVEGHGGRIWATRNDGPGLTVQFSLPADGADSR